MAADEVYLPLAGLVDTDDGPKLLHRGDSVPENVTKDGLKRLKDHGNIGDLSEVARPDAGSGDVADALVSPEVADVAALDDEALEEWAKDHTVDEIVAAASTQELAERLVVAEDAGKGRSTVRSRIEEALAKGDDPDAGSGDE